MRINMELCDVCGSCVSVCPSDAIYVEEHRVRINEELCIKCGKCVIVCPFSAIREGDK